MHYDVRPLTDADAPAWWRLDAEAFGGSLRQADDAHPPAPGIRRAGRTPYGVFDDERLIAKAEVVAFACWFGGRPVPTAGIASVTTQLEARGGGLLSPLFERMHEEAVAAGVGVATLYPTAPGIYRSLGYEVVGAYSQVEIRTADLALLPPGRAGTRRATRVDMPTVQSIYRRWAASRNGPLTRTGEAFPAEPDALWDDLREKGQACTLAIDADDRALGYVLWSRTGGHRSSGACEVAEIFAVEREGYPALLRALGTNASVAPVTRIWTSGLEPIRHILPTNSWALTDERPYMVSVLDVPSAFEARGWPVALDCRLDLGIAGGRGAGAGESYSVTVAQGRARVEPLDGSAGRIYTPRGLAMAFAGVQNSATIRALGHLAGPELDDDLWDTLLATHQFHIRDYF